MKDHFHSLEPVLEGGRGQASGFIMRAMAENKAKHDGTYKNPTWPLKKGSTMNKPIEFDWKKVANKDQGGLGEVGNKTTWGTKRAYGASPFILHHFSGEPKPWSKGNKQAYPKETDNQRQARIAFTVKGLLKKAKELAETTGEKAQLPIDVIKHFGNIPEKEKSPTLEISEVSEQPPIDSKKPEEPKEREVSPPVVEKKKPKPKVAESPTPSNPIVWTEEVLRSHPATKVSTANWYDDLDERQKKLTLFALNNPKAKLAEAVKYLKDNNIGKGFTSSTISPIYKEIRKEVDEILAEVAEADRILTSPSYKNLKDKLNTLLSSESKSIRILKNAFSDIDVDKYIKAYNEFKKANDGVAPTFNTRYELKYDSNGDWELKAGNPTANNVIKTNIRSGIRFELEGKNIQFVNDGKGHIYAVWRHMIIPRGYEAKAPSLDSQEPDVIINNLVKEGTHYHITPGYTNDNINLELYLTNSDFINPIETPPQRLKNLSSVKKTKPESRVFYLQSLYEFNQSVEIGIMLMDWITKKPRKQEPNRFLTAKEKKAFLAEQKKAIPSDSDLYDVRKYKIRLARAIKKTVRESEIYDYKFEYNTEEYVSPRKQEGVFDKDVFAPEWMDDKKPKSKKTGKGLFTDLLNSAGLGLLGGYKLNTVSEADAKNPDEIKLLPIKNKVRYEKAKEELLEALSNYTVPPVASRANLLGKQSGMMAGKKSGDGILARGVAYGFGNNRRGFNYYVKNKEHPEVYKALVAFGEAIVPKGWDFQTIQLNHNAKAKKHRDKNNVGKSVIIGIGDYNGGELRVWDKDDGSPKDYNIKDRPTMFNGALLSHETQPFNNPTEYEPGKGRYTIVYFRHKYRPDSGNVGVGSGHSDGMPQPSNKELNDLFV